MENYAVANGFPDSNLHPDITIINPDIIKNIFIYFLKMSVIDNSFFLL